MVAGLCALVATVGLGGSLLAQAPSPSLEPSTVVEAADADLFPSAEEVSEILGVEVESLGVHDGLSQAWEGSDFYSDSLPSAQMATYTSPQGEDEGPLTGVVIDIVRFESGDDALRHTKDTMFGDDVVAKLDFETDLGGDLVATMSWAADDGVGGSVIVLVTGPVAIVVVALASDAPEMEAESEAIVGLILDRLSGET
jgi:hypothetical protein